MQRHPILKQLPWLFFGVYLAVSFFAVFHGYLVILPAIIVLSLFLVISVITHESKRFIYDWAVFLALILLFDWLRGFIFIITQHFHLPIYAHYVIRWEQFLLHGHLGPIIFQKLFHITKAKSAWNLVFLGMYVSHFLAFLILGLMLWYTDTANFQRYKIAMYCIMATALLCFLLVPTMPPWLAAIRHFTPPIIASTMSVHLHILIFFNTLFETNPVAAVPSIHASFAMIVTLVAIHQYRWKACWLALYPITLDIACMALGTHYFVGLMLGNLLAIVAYLIAFHTSFFTCTSTDKPITNDRFWYKTATALIILFCIAGLRILSAHL